MSRHRSLRTGVLGLFSWSADEEVDGVSNEELLFAVSTVWVVVAAVLGTRGGLAASGGCYAAS
ncbi:MAG: hypothetical protein ACRDPX_02445 [Gaiellaceae bacterium]